MSEMALDLIRRAKAEGWKRLDLGNTEIVGEVPAEIWGLDELEELILSDKWLEWGNGLQRSENTGSENKISSFPAHPILPSGQEDIPQPIAASAAEKNTLPDLGLGRLQKLVLARTQVADIQPLAQLRKLTQLDLQNTQVADIQPLAQLLQLTYLSLTNTQVADIQPLAQLRKLTHLNLSNTQVADIQPLAQLRKLTQLDLRNTQVAGIQPLAQLRELVYLDLADTQVYDIQPLTQLKQLNYLFLARTAVDDLTPLAHLKSLTTLHLHNTQVADLKNLTHLSQLAYLDLAGTQIADIQPLARLLQLTYLDLTGTQVSDIQPLAQLKRLSHLFLQNTEVADIQPLAQFKQLSHLFLQNTQVADIQPLAQLKQLSWLYLQNTQVADIQPLKSLIQKGLAVESERLFLREGINIRNCPLTNPPYEIALQGNQAILNYWKERNRVKTFPLQEIKLFLLGNSTAGKSTLREALITNHFDETTASTHGADLSKVWPNEDTTINIWDFGGQEYFHATYRLLMNDEAVYVLVIDPCHNQDSFQSTDLVYDPAAPKEKEDLEHFHHRYWMETIHAHAPNSKVLVVWNKLEIEDRKQGTLIDADKKGMDAEQLREFRLGIRAALRDKDKNWLPEWKTFIQSLKRQIQAKLQGKEVLSYWPDVRKDVEARAQHDICISREEFDALVRAGDAERDVDLCIIYLRNICGTILYWGDDSDLKDVVFINPNCINTLIYNVLSREIKLDGGRFNRDWVLNKVELTLKHPDFSVSDLTFEKVAQLANELISVMKQFKIIFAIKGQNHEYVAPQYLPAMPPASLSREKQWDGIGEQPHFWIRFEGYVPRHVFPCFVVCNGPIACHRLYWKTGILYQVVENLGIKALVEVHYRDRTITMSSNATRQHAENLRVIFHDLLDIIGAGTPISISLDGKTYLPYSRLDKAFKAGLPKVENEFGEFEAWGELKKWMPDDARPASRTKRKISDKAPKSAKPTADREPEVKTLLTQMAQLMEMVRGVSQQNQHTHTQLAEINGLLQSYFDIILDKIADFQDDQGQLRSDLQWMLLRLNDKADLAEGLLQHLLQRQGELDAAIAQGMQALPAIQQQAIQALQPAQGSPLWKDAAKAIKLKLSTLTLVAAALAATTPAAPVALPALLAASTVNVEATLPEALRGVWKILRKIAEPFRMDGR